MTPTGGERCRVPTPPTCASGRSRPTRPARAASPRSRGATGSASGRSRAGSSSPARRGAAIPSRAAAAGPPLGGERETLAALVAERNDATLAEYADLLAERAGVRRSPSALCRALKALGLVRKKRRVKAAEQDREDVAEARRAWRAELAGVDPARLVFIDETGIDTRMTRAYARAASGRARRGQGARGGGGSG